MKINGPNQSNFNPYNKIMQKQVEQKRTVAKQDQIEISPEAKQLQESVKTNTQRTEYVQSIKNQIESGNYTIDPEKIAKKMIDFWSK